MHFVGADKPWHRIDEIAEYCAAVHPDERPPLKRLAECYWLQMYLQVARRELELA